MLSVVRNAPRWIKVLKKHDFMDEHRHPSPAAERSPPSRLTPRRSTPVGAPSSSPQRPTRALTRIVDRCAL